MENDDDVELGPVASALAASITLQGEAFELPVAATDAARLALRNEVNEEVLVEIAAVRARLERLAGEAGSAVCVALDELLDYGVTLLDAAESRVEHAPADGLAAFSDAHQAVRAPLAPTTTETPATPRPRRGVRAKRSTPSPG
jgi:hypothetical protein